MRIILTFAVFMTFAFWMTSYADPTAKKAARLANEHAIRSGSPFRWEIQPEQTPHGGAILRRVMIGSPGVTAADAVLKRDVLANIKNNEGETTNRQSEEPKEIRIVSQTAVSSTEIWVFDGLEKDIVYVVKFQAGDAGGTTMEITGPWSSRVAE